MTKIKGLTRLRFDVERDLAAGELVNLIQNPSGDLGGWGWLTPVSGSRIIAAFGGFVELGLFLDYQTVAGTNYFTSEDLPVTAGNYVAASWACGTAASGSVTTSHQVRFEFYNASGSLVSSSTLTGTLGAGAQSYPATVVPATAVNVRLRFNLASTTASQFFGFRYVAVATAATSAALSGTLPLSPAYYTNIIGTSASLSIERQELNLSTLTGTVVSTSLDPSTSTLLRPGRRCVLYVDTTGSGGWEPIFTGRLKKAEVAYQLLEPNAAKRAVITLTAVDALTRLAQESRPDGVGTIAALPYVLEGCGVPWSVNGSGQQVATATIVASNDQATAVDQIAVTRDSNGGYAWVDRKGIVQVWDAASISNTVAATLTESDYTTDFGIDFATDRVVNVVSVESYEVNPATGETAVAQYGPFRDEASIRQWDAWEKTFTVQGLTSAQITTLANAIIAANKTPTRRVNYVVLPLTVETISRALLDLYDLVTVVNTRAGLSDSLRIVGVTHTIEATQQGTTWLLRLNFAGDDTVAPPQVIPKPSAGSGATASGYTGLTTSGTSSGTVRYVVVEGFIYVNINVALTAALAAGSTMTLVTAANGLPAALRPSAAVNGPVFTPGTPNGFAVVNTDGSITIRSVSGSLTSAAGQVIFPAGL